MLIIIIIIIKNKNRRAIKSNMNTHQNMSKEWGKKKMREQKSKQVNSLPITFDNIHLRVQRKTNMHLIILILLLLS